MIKKIITLVICLSIISIYAAENRNCLNELYKNRHYIMELVDSCKTGSGYDCSKLAVFDSFKIYAKEPIERWQKDEYYLWDAFFKVCSSSFALIKIKSIVLDDSILTDILVAALTHSDQRHISGEAYKLLVIKASYPQLIKAHKLILKAVTDCGLSQQNKNILVGLSSTAKDSCKYLLADTTLPNYIRARLGDTLSENKLLMEFDTTNNYKKKEKLAVALSIAGTQKCLKHLIINFNKPVFNHNKYGCITSSLRLTIIECFQKYHPREPLFNEIWKNMSGGNFVPDNIICDTNNVKNYLNAVIDFYYKTYNVKPVDPAPEPILIKKPDCGIEGFLDEIN